MALLLLSAVSFALPRGAPPWAAAACVALTCASSAEPVAAALTDLAAALLFRITLVLATLLHEARAAAICAPRRVPPTPFCVCG